MHHVVLGDIYEGPCHRSSMWQSICYSDSQVYYANAAKYIIVVVSDGFAGCKAERSG